MSERAFPSQMMTFPPETSFSRSRLEITFASVLFTLFFKPRVHQQGVLKNLEQKARKWNIHSREPKHMSSPESINGLSFLTLAGAAPAAKQTKIHREIMELYDEFRSPLLRYGLSLGLSIQDAEEVTQEVFLALFRHLHFDRSRKNLRAWLFRVTHNLALKQRLANQASLQRTAGDTTLAEGHAAASLNPEEQMSAAQRRDRLRAVVKALSEKDQNCLRLRAEGLRYREIATVLGVSLGAVSTSLTRSLARLARADGR